MDDKDQGFWEKFEEYVEETKDLFDPDVSKMIKIALGEENPFFGIFSHVLNRKVNNSRPLTFALATLEAYYENALWDESMKKEIVSYISIIEEHCKNPDLRCLLPQEMLNLTYHALYGYGERLAEFDVDQQEQITKAIDLLYKYVAKSRRRC